MGLVVVVFFRRSYQLQRALQRALCWQVNHKMKSKGDLKYLAMQDSLL